MSGPLFTTETGTVLAAAHIGHYLLVRRNKLPIEKFTTHDLRRTVATMLAEMGVALDLVAAVVGHGGGSRETRTLVRHYVRTDLIVRKAQILSGWDERVQSIVTGGKATKNAPSKCLPVFSYERPVLTTDPLVSRPPDS
jgi:hypothetical protein